MCLDFSSIGSADYKDYALVIRQPINGQGCEMQIRTGEPRAACVCGEANRGSQLGPAALPDQGSAYR